MTIANEKGLYIGKTDYGLSAKGIQQLLELKTRYGYPKPDLLFTSPLARCRQTLQILYPDREAQVVEGLAECDFGDWEGQSIAQLQQREDFIQWVRGNKFSRIPNGEDPRAFQQRVLTAFEQVVQTILLSGKPEALICTHGGVISLILLAYGLPKLPMHQTAAGPGGGFVLRITPSLWSKQPVAEILGRYPEPETAEEPE